ncbi:ABC transporter family protein, partial [Chlamydia psittaci 10_743_SC13]
RRTLSGMSTISKDVGVIWN